MYGVGEVATHPRLVDKMISAVELVLQGLPPLAKFRAGGELWKSYSGVSIFDGSCTD